MEYTKIKSGEFKNNKVTALEFSIFNKISKVRNEKANELVGMISQYIKDFKFTYDMFYKALGYIDFEELKSVIKIIIKNTSDISNIENEINLFITNKFKLNNYKKIYEFFGKYKNPLTLQNFIFKNLSGIVELEFFKDNIASIDFLKKLYFAKEGEQLFFEEKDIIIGIKYFKKKESVIEVFQRIK